MNAAYYELTSKKLGEESFASLEELMITNINVSCLILHGEYDFIPQEASAQLAKKLQNSELYTVRNAGHFSFIEKRDEVIEKIENFLQEVP
ncbi:2-succinyl-6-hydroxy-2,4-cyclohexadiene-1-carboxylate synthase [compost metagenome]